MTVEPALKAILTEMVIQLESLTEQRDIAQREIAGLKAEMNDVKVSRVQADGGSDKANYNPLISKQAAPEILGPKASFRSWAKRFKLIMGGKDEQVVELLQHKLPQGCLLLRLQLVGAILLRRGCHLRSAQVQDGSAGRRADSGARARRRGGGPAWRRGRRSCSSHRT